MIWCSLPTVAAWKALPSAPRISRQCSTPPSGPATAGICGRRSPRRILPSAIPKVLLSAGAVQLESATITTLDDKIPQYIKKICKRDPFSGHTVTGGIVTVKDSSWLLSWTLNRQQQFRDQPKNQLCVWVYGLFSDKPGDYVKKPMRDCTGREICMEWLYHIGVPERTLPSWLSTAPTLSL